MCRDKVVADSGSPNIKLTKMTWNFHYRTSFSQAPSIVAASNAMRTKSNMKLTRHSKSIRSVRRKGGIKRKPGTVHGSKDKESVTLERQVLHNVASLEPIDTIDRGSVDTTPVKRSTTLRRRAAFKRRSVQKTEPLRKEESPSQSTDKDSSGQVMGEEALQCKDVSLSDGLPDCSLDPSQIVIEVADNEEDTILSQSPNPRSKVEQQLELLRSLDCTDCEEEVERDAETSPDHVEHAPTAIPSSESVLSNDSGISSLNSSPSVTTESLSSVDQCPLRLLPCSAAAGRRPRSSSRGRVRIRRRPRKILVVGDMCSGKSSIVSAYCRDRFTDSYLPTILNCCFSDAEVLGEKIELVLIDVSGRDDYKRLRECAYHKVDAVILCYSIANATSIDNIVQKWIPELKKHASRVPYILVGTKKDLRDDALFECEEENSTLSSEMVLTEKGEEVAKAIGAQSFHECSALYREGTRDVFERITKVALRKSRRKRKTHANSPTTCTIL